MKSLSWCGSLSSLHHDALKPLDAKLQVAARLFASEQHSLHGHVLVESVNESTSKGIFCSKEWLAQHERLNTQPVFWCSLGMKQSKVKLGKLNQCMYMMVLTTFAVPEQLTTCCSNEKSSGRSLLPSRLPKAYYSALAGMLLEISIPVPTYKAVKKSKPKSPKPTAEEGPGEHTDVDNMPTNKKAQIQSHYDDCGDDVSTIAFTDIADRIFECNSECDVSDDEFDGDLLNHAFYSWSCIGSNISEQEPLHSKP